jgi:hypothetical protein
MTLRQYLILMTAGTSLSWIAVGLIVATVDPNKAPLAVFAVFYASMFLAMTGTFSVIGFLMRIGLLKQQLVVSRHVAVSFRQSLLLASLVVIAMYLASKSLLNWWNALIIVAGLTIFEFFFISAKNTEPRREQ